MVPASPEEVHTIVFWSKNFGPFLQKDYGKKLLKYGYHLFFNFTVNSEDHVLEPQISPLDERFEQARSLSRQFGAEVISWRFDPICFYQDCRGNHNSLHDFQKIASAMNSFGIKRCITSFMDDYRKIQKRISKINKFSFIYPHLQEQIKILLVLERFLHPLSIDLFTCCEGKLLDSLPSFSKIKPSSCIPNDLLHTLFGGNISLANDYGQRRQKGCRCKVSRDIGSYIHQPCHHNCLYCYANPVL